MIDLREKVHDHAKALDRLVRGSTGDRTGWIGEIEDTRRAVEAVAIQPELVAEPEYVRDVAVDDRIREILAETERLARLDLEQPAIYCEWCDVEMHESGAHRRPAFVSEGETASDLTLCRGCASEHDSETGRTRPRPTDFNPGWPGSGLGFAKS